MTNVLRDSLELRPLHGDFGVEALGIDIAQPLEPAVADVLREAFGRHRLLVIRGQALSPAAHIAFTRQFGELEVHVLNEYHKAEHPEIFELSNIGPDGKPNAVHPDLGTLFWHSDGSFQKLPALATLLYAERAPASGGHTLFADMSGAWEALGAAERERFRTLRVLHDLHVSRLKAGYGDVGQPRDGPSRDGIRHRDGAAGGAAHGAQGRSADSGVRRRTMTPQCRLLPERAVCRRPLSTAWRR